MTAPLPRNDEGAIVLNAVEAKALALLLVHRHLRDDGYESKVTATGPTLQAVLYKVLAAAATTEVTP